MIQNFKLKSSSWSLLFLSGSFSFGSTFAVSFAYGVVEVEGRGGIESEEGLRQLQFRKRDKRKERAALEGSTFQEDKSDGECGFHPFSQK